MTHEVDVHLWKLHLTNEDAVRRSLKACLLARITDENSLDRVEHEADIAKQRGKIEAYRAIVREIEPRK